MGVLLLLLLLLDEVATILHIIRLINKRAHAIRHIQIRQQLNLLIYVLFFFISSFKMLAVKLTFMHSRKYHVIRRFASRLYYRIFIATTMSVASKVECADLLVHSHMACSNWLFLHLVQCMDVW